MERRVRVPSLTSREVDGGVLHLGDGATKLVVDDLFDGPVLLSSVTSPVRPGNGDEGCRVKGAFKPVVVNVQLTEPRIPLDGSQRADDVVLLLVPDAAEHLRQAILKWLLAPLDDLGPHECQ